MDRFFEFVGNHPFLILATIGVLIAIIVTEIIRIRSGGSTVEPATATQLYNRESGLFVDLRPEADFRKAHLPGALHLPAGSLEQRLDKLAAHRDRPIIVYCGNGLQSGRVAVELKKRGFAKVYQLRGGLAGWLEAGYPVEGK